MVYVTADGDNSYVTCSCLESSAVWLRTVMSPRCVNLKKLDLSGAKGHIKLAGNSVGALLQPLHDGARVRELILSNSPLQDNGALAIAAYLKSARCALEILDVSECFLWTGDPSQRPLRFCLCTCGPAPRGPAHPVLPGSSPCRHCLGCSQLDSPSLL